jgi:hypothetical protein
MRRHVALRDICRIYHSEGFSTLRLKLRISMYTYIYDVPKRYLDMHGLDKVRDVAARHASSVVDVHILDF